MNDRYFDHCLTKAVEKYILNQAEPDSERLWQRIEDLIKTYERNKRYEITKKRRGKLYLQVAMALTVIFTFLVVLSITSIGEALPASFPLRNFFRKLISETQMIIQFNTDEKDVPADTQEPDFDRIYEVEGPQYSFNEINFEDLIALYEGDLYIPAPIPLSRLKKIQYCEAGNLFTIIMDFRDGDRDIVFTQEDTGEGGYYGKGYDVEDTEVTLQQVNGIQYLVYKRRYNIIEVDWHMHKKAFNITGNMSADEALSLAQSVEIYKP